MQACLKYQGANPKTVGAETLRDLIELAHLGSNTEASYCRKVKNRTTAIRAYCVTCMGGGVADVSKCPSLTCPLHPFRMGKDPLRGFDIKKPDTVFDFDDNDIGLFEDEEDTDGD